jgi:hypothetical protein
LKGIVELIGEYDVYSDDNETEMQEEVKQILMKNISIFKEALKLEDLSEDGYVNYTSLANALVGADLDLDKQSFDYIMFFVYK